MGQHDLQPAFTGGPPVAHLRMAQHAVGGRHRPLGVHQHGLAHVPEPDLLLVGEWRDGRVFALALASPPSQEEGDRFEVRMLPEGLRHGRLTLSRPNWGSGPDYAPHSPMTVQSGPQPQPDDLASARTSADTVPAGSTDEPVVPSRAARHRTRRAWWQRPAVVILAVTAFAGGLRFYHLSAPHAYVFDETYYAKDGCLDTGYPYKECHLDKPSEQTFTVHPPLGRWIIAGSEKAFGNRPFGWRFASVVAGTLSVSLTA